MKIIIKSQCLILVKEISRTALIKHRMKANKNVLVYELESTALVSVLRDSKAFDKLAIEFDDKVTNNDDRVETLLSLVDNGNSDVVEEFLSALKDLNYCHIVELIDPADIHTKAGKCTHYLHLLVFTV